MTYAEKLLDQRWQKKRLELFEAAGWQCQSTSCPHGETGEKPTLHVHHRIYLRGKNPWEYEDWAYLVLCDYCHKQEQYEMERQHAALAQSNALQNLAVLWILFGSENRAWADSQIYDLNAKFADRLLTT